MCSSISKKRLSMFVDVAFYSRVACECVVAGIQRTRYGYRDHTDNAIVKVVFCTPGSSSNDPTKMFLPATAKTKVGSVVVYRATDAKVSTLSGRNIGE